MNENKSRFRSFLTQKIDFESKIFSVFKVPIFWEGHKILWNLCQLFDWQYIGQIIGGDFANFVAFSDYMKFTRINKKRKYHCHFLTPSPYHATQNVVFMY